jgi:hypothetical protein
VEWIYADGKVIGSVEYDGRHDHFRASSIHQVRPLVFYTESRARQWIRQLHAEETAS